MDGPVRVGQCPIAPGDNFVYTFTANPAGSFWYHSHDSGQVSSFDSISDIELIISAVPRRPPWTYDYP